MFIKFSNLILHSVPRIVALTTVCANTGEYLLLFVHANVAGICRNQAFPEMPRQLQKHKAFPEMPRQLGKFFSI